MQRTKASTQTCKTRISSAFDKIPDEILWMMLKYSVPDDPLMNLPSQAVLVKLEIPKDKYHQEPRIPHLGWRSNWCPDAVHDVGFPNELTLSLVCRRWRRLSMLLNGGWAAFDPVLLSHPRQWHRDRFGTVFHGLVTDPLRIACVRHFAPRLFGYTPALAKQYAQRVIQKITASQLATLDLSFGIDVNHAAPQLASFILNWYLKGGVDAARFRNLNLTSLSLEWPQEENPHYERIRPQLALFMAAAPSLSHICIHNSPNILLQQVIATGGFTRALKTLVFGATTSGPELVNLELVAKATASTELETLVVESGFEGNLETGFSHLRELCVRFTSFEDEDWREPTWTLDLLESIPADVCSRLETLRIIFPSDGWHSSVTIFNGAFAIRFLGIFKDDTKFSNLSCLELEIGRIKVGHLALLLRLVGTRLKSLRVGRIFDTALDDSKMYFALEEHAEAEILRPVQDECERASGVPVDEPAVDRTFPDVTTNIITHERYRDGEIISYENIQQDVLFWPTELEVGEKGKEMWRNRTKKLLKHYCPVLNWAHLWYGFTDDSWEVALEL
ncbi:hypothetical protein HDU77_002423 [Chytriomyces hyalinus]|nr:hypothetical protein HDU77_002423 [Chytriomyces hyalinus]